MSTRVRRALLVLLLALLGTCLLLRHQGIAGSDRQVLVLARQEATAFFSLDPTHITADLEHVTAPATPAFRKQYAAMRDQLAKAVRAGQLTVSTSLRPDAAAVEYESARAASVLVAVDVSTTRTDGASESNRYRMRLRLVRTGGRWLVDAIEQVG